VLLWQTSNTINFAQGEFVVLPGVRDGLFFVISPVSSSPPCWPR